MVRVHSAPVTLLPYSSLSSSSETGSMEELVDVFYMQTDPGSASPRIKVVQYHLNESMTYYYLNHYSANKIMKNYD